MKLITYQEQEGAQKVGALLDDLQTIVDLSEKFVDMPALIDGGQAALDLARQMVEARAATVLRGEVKLKAPLPVPRQIRDFMCFEKHFRQAYRQGARRKVGVLAPLLTALGLVRIPRVWYEQPIYYKSNRFSVIGPDEDVIWPAYSQEMDFELELAIVIGGQGKDIPLEKARDHIFGYTIFNDMSARDAQFEEMACRLGPAKGKDFDTGNVIGPWLVTADEIPDPYHLTMVARVNGEQWGRGFSGDMHHRFEDMIAHVSRSETIYPGELFGSGTVGDGCGLEHGRFLQPGDLIELEIEGLGQLRNRLIKP
ncbi:MAG: fumarylacetoacetate hydrolase family protein [Proteobacteria bacterium]|nr:fumarylacetoacetate hydrolase family protein [Pseudomonadota bacterium]MBU1740194.1 fumarylacetoacetate hydrolase family protein [Pseudomonadota bacterium]